MRPNRTRTLSATNTLNTEHAHIFSHHFSHHSIVVQVIRFSRLWHCGKKATHSFPSSCLFHFRRGSEGWDICVSIPPFSLGQAVAVKFSGLAFALCAKTNIFEG